MGDDRPLSSCRWGKLIWSNNTEVYNANLKALISKNVKDLENYDLNVKEMGNLDIFPK